MHRPAGFTFIEVLIALLLCVLMIGVLASAVMHITRLDRRTGTVRETLYHLQTVACRTYLGAPTPEAAVAGLTPEWEYGRSEVEVTIGDQRTPWVVWRIDPGPSATVPREIGLRAGYEGW